MAVGLLSALGYTALSPRRVVADSLVLLPPAPASATAPRDMGTETRIATSSSVLKEAIKATGTTTSVADLQQRVTASAVTSALLDIHVEDTSSRRAITLSNAVARAYVAYSKQLASQSGETLVRTLGDRASQLTAELNALDAQIADQTAKVSELPPGTPDAASAGAELNALENRRTSVTQDLDAVNQSINTTNLNALGETKGLRVLEPATSANGPSLLATALPFLTATLIALVAGSAAALWWDRRDDRARRRKDIAAATGAPVLASLQARRGSESDSSAGAYPLASDRDEEALRHLERRLANGANTCAGFVVVSLSGDDAAIQVVRQLSEAAAQSGLETALFAQQTRQSPGGLCVPPTNLRDATRNPEFYELHRMLEDAAPSADLAIVLVITDGAKLELPRWSASMPAVLSVSAGFARREELASVSAMMRAASRPFAGVIVTNPDPRDGTNAWQVPTTESQLVPTRTTGMAWGAGVVSRRFKADKIASQHDNGSTGGDPAPSAMTLARTEVPTNGHRVKTSVEHVGDDIVVWRVPDEGAWTSTSSLAASAVPEPADAEEAHEPLGGGAGSRFVNFHFILGALKRQRRWVIGLAIVGLAVGLLMSVAFAPAPRAETTVLLTYPTASDPLQAIVTDTQLLNTDAVARRVVNSLHLVESPATFAASYTGSARSDDLLGISVSASSGSDAVRRANALASEYLAYRADVYQRQSNTIIKGLQQRQAAIQGQINELNRQLGAQPGSNSSTDPETAALLAQRAGLNDDLTALNSAIVDQTNSSAAVVDGSFAIDKATLVEHSAVKEVGRNALSGLAAGLAIGLALVVLLAVTSNRVWRRDDVAVAMRHAVDLSTGPIRVGRRTTTLAMETLIAQPTPELAKVVAHLRHQLATSTSGDRSLAVIAVGGLEVAAASVCATATALARDGEHVVVVDASERSIVSRHGMLHERDSETTDGDASGRIRVVSLTNRRGAPSNDTDEIVLVSAVLDPAEGAEPIRELASTAVVIVTAGRSTMATLGAVSDMLEVAQVELLSVVLVGSSTHDESFGRPAADPQASAPAPSGESDGWSVFAAGL